MNTTIDRVPYEVLVKRKRDGTLFVCRQERNGIWRCGRCLRGVLGALPKERRKCRVCGSWVAEIRYDPPRPAPSWWSHRYPFA